MLKSTPSWLLRLLLRMLAPRECTGGGLIRLGPQNDGGYLVPASAIPARFVASPGVADTAGFEADLLEQGAVAFLCDPHVDRPPFEREGLYFEKKALSTTTSISELTLAEIVAWGADRVGAGGWILQMDVEGAEWCVIGGTKRRVLKNFGVIVVEFHDLEKLFFPRQFLRCVAVFSKLLADFHVSHIHANNCRPAKLWKGIEIPSIVEVTFHRRRDCRLIGAAELPHSLDRPCLPDRDEVYLSADWQGN